MASTAMTARQIAIAPQLLNRLEKTAALHAFTVDEALKVAVEAWVEAHCPVPGCPHVFMSRGGWDGHVASLRAHPNWHPDVKDGKERKQLFKQKHPGWTTGAKAPRVG